jgi:hypothetical protein
MSRGERISFSRAREHVSEAVEAGAGLEDLEHGLLDRLALSRDARDALWLFAWETIERRESRSSVQASPRWRAAQPPR